jgi:hypothetical protein
MPSTRFGSSSIRTMTQAGTDVRWLEQIGHVSGRKHAFSRSGGADTFSCNLLVPPDFRTSATDPGRILQEVRGGSIIWDGILDEPSPGEDGWALSAQGNGNSGDDYRALFSSWPSGQPDAVVNAAIALSPGPLRWVNPGIGSPSGIYMSQPPDSGSSDITDVLNLVTSMGGLYWYVNTTDYGNILKVSALSTTPDRLLIVNNPVPRTLGGDVNVIYLRYQSGADNTTTGTPATFAVTSVSDTNSINLHGRKEIFIDISSAGTMSAGTAQGIGSKVMLRYQRASFAGPFVLSPGQYLTMGGQPVDIGAETADHVFQLVMSDFAYGGEVAAQNLPVISMVGKAEYDDDAETLTITPFQYLALSLSDLLSAAVNALPQPTSN